MGEPCLSLLEELISIMDLVQRSYTFSHRLLPPAATCLVLPQHTGRSFCLNALDNRATCHAKG